MIDPDCPMCTAGVPHDERGSECAHTDPLEGPFGAPTPACCLAERAARWDIERALEESERGWPVRPPSDPEVDPVGAVWFA